MPNRIGALLMSLLGVAIALATAVPADAQSTTAGRAATFTAPRTPWGDPDISGNFSNKYELGTPFERPAEFEGRRIEDFSPAEIAELARRRQELNLLNYPHQGDPENPAGNLGGPNTWGDRFEIGKGSRPWFVVEPDGRIPALTPEARQRGAGGAGRAASRTYVAGPQAPWEVWRDQQNMSLYDRCITRGLPGSMTPASYGNSYHILQTPDYVAIRYEMVHETRIIPLDGRPHAAPSIRQYMGIARGRWEGNSLVVETVNLRNGYRGANAATLKYVERFTRIAPNVVEWRMTIEDPTTWTRPWTFAIPLTENDSEAIVEYACHEGNRSMPLRLRAGRTAELTAADAAQKGITVAEREFFFDEDEERLEQERAEQRKQQQPQPPPRR
jgi:hypothetical protein